MAESHVVSGLVSKRSELIGVIDYHQNKIKQIKADMASVDAAIKVFDPDYDLRTIKAKQYRAKNNFFKHGEGNTLLLDIMREASGTLSSSGILEEVARRKGFDLEAIDCRALSACLFTILKRLQNKGVLREESRSGNLIQWAMV